MPSKPSKKPAPARKSLPARPVAPPSDDPAIARVMHREVLPGAIYCAALKPMLGDKADPNASDYASDVIARMAPRDPAEEMLIAQLLFAHARVTRLTELANKQTSVEALRVIHEHSDRASNTYRRLMLALAEYRRPPPIR